MPFRVKFAYERDPDGQERPYLWLGVTGPNGQLQYVRGLLDSGADVSVLVGDYAQLLGYGNDLLMDLEVGGTGGATRVRRARVPLVAQLRGRPEPAVPLSPLFAPDTGQSRWGRDFMEVYAVSFAQRDRQFTVYAE